MPCLSPRQERFAQLLAGGMTQLAAYEAAGYEPDDGHPSRLADNGRVKARVAEIQGRGAARVEWGIAQATEYLMEIVMTPVAEVDADHPICQERTYIDGKEETSVKLKTPDKLRALDMLMRLKGMYPKDESAGALPVDLAQFLSSIRRPGLPRRPTRK